jgi:hypothetical protein
MTSGVVVAIPWYRREDWGRLKSIVSDAATLHDAFEDWQNEAVNVERRLRRHGHQVKRVVIDVDAFRACASFAEGPLMPRHGRITPSRAYGLEARDRAITVATIRRTALPACGTLMRR